MAVVETLRRQVAIAGRVTDGRTGAPLRDASVRITAAPPGTPLDQARVAGPAADGLYYCLDLPDGAYTVEASLPALGSRYGRVSAQVTVSRDAGGKIAMAPADLALPSTTIRGRVTGPNNLGMSLVHVRVRGSGEWTLTDRQGDYALTAVEAGARRIEFSAQGFQTAVQTVQLSQPGALVTLNMVLNTQ